MIKPIFKSTYSTGKSILTLDEIIDICDEGDMNNVTIVEDNLTSFMKAFHLCKQRGKDLPLSFLTKKILI